MTFGLPDSTEVNRQIPKRYIIERFGLTGKERSRFDSTIHRIFISNELSPRTVNLPEGRDVKSIFIVIVELQSGDYDEKVISMLFNIIEQRAILVLESGIDHRPIVFRGMPIPGEWVQDLSFRLNGLDLDEVWDDLVKQIGSIVIEEGNDLDSQILVDAERRRCDAEVARLRKRMASERQPRRKRALYDRIRELTEGRP